jgi:ATP-dependent 26S proteasome regulatory subunit
VIFATNSIETYNKAFETRVRHIHIPMPDEACSQKLWQIGLHDLLLRATEVNPEALARQFSDLSGREIKRIVAEAVQKAISEQRSQLEMSDLNAVVTRLKKERLHEDSDVTIDSLAKKQYEAQDPRYTFEDLVVSKKVKDELLRRLAIIQKEAKLFDEWGLRSIEKFPCTALNFYGPPGTGKTLAAHAVAKRLNQKILVASYGEIIGQLVGDAARNTNIIFRAAARMNAVLFIDEADALLARRLGNVAHSADMELNSLSNQMLIALENFHGVVIFATNMIHNYDKAFETRVSHIHFPMPDEECRKRLWDKHLPEKLPRTDDVDPVKLAAQIDDVCGRDIKNAVIAAAAQVAQDGRSEVELHDLVGAIKRIKDSRISQQVERDTKRKQMVERIQRQLFPENPGGTSSSQPSTRPLNEIFEESDQVILLQPLVQAEQSVMPESLEPVPAPRQAAQNLVIRRNERSGDKEGPAAPETPVPTSIGLEQDDVDGETELNTSTQPLAGLQRKPSGQLERIPD